MAVLFPLSPLALVVMEIVSCAWRRSSNQPADENITFAITKMDHPSHDDGQNLYASDDKNLEAISTELDKFQIRNGNDPGENRADQDDTTTAILDSPEYRSSKWMSIAVWLLVISVTLLASTQLAYTYVGFSLSGTVPALLPLALGALPISCYAWALMGLHMRSEATHHASGYRHCSRFIKWTTKPSASQFMIFTAAFCPLGILILMVLDVLGSQNPLSRGSPGRDRVFYLFDGSFWAIVGYFFESIYVNFVMWFFNRRAPQGTSEPNVGR